MINSDIDGHLIGYKMMYSDNLWYTISCVPFCGIPLTLIYAGVVSNSSFISKCMGAASFRLGCLLAKQRKLLLEVYLNDDEKKQATKARRVMLHVM